MISVLNPSVQVGHPIIGLVLEVQVIRMVHQPRPEGERQPPLQVPDHGVDEGRWDGYAEPLEEEGREAVHVFLDYVPHWNK